MMSLSCVQRAAVSGGAGSEAPCKAWARSMVQEWASPRTYSNKSMRLIRRALRCLEALAAGHTERAAISSLPDLPATLKPQDAAISELYGLPGPPGQQLPSLGLPGQLPTAAPVRPPNIARMQQAGTLSSRSRLIYTVVPLCAGPVCATMWSRKGVTQSHKKVG